MQNFLPEQAAGAGYLTYMLAYFRHWHDGFAAYQRLDAARRAGQAPDPADAARAMVPRADPWTAPSFAYQTINVTGDLAYLEAVGDGQIYRVHLVLRGGRWLVAGEDNTPLAVAN